MENVAKFLDDFDDGQVINLILAKKHFADVATESFWEARSKRKHPSLLKFKKKRTWKSHYFHMIRKLHMIAEKHGEDYENLVTHIFILHEKYKFDYYTYALTDLEYRSSLDILNEKRE